MQQQNTFEPVISFFRMLSNINVTPTGFEWNEEYKRKQTVQRAGTFSFEGRLDRGQSSLYAIRGEDIVLTEDTWTIGIPALGAQAVAKGVVRCGKHVVTKLVVARPGA